MVASTVDVEQEETISAAQEVNSASYLSLHSGQMFTDGLSFSGNERDKVWLNTGTGFADLSSVSGADSPNDGRAAIAHDFDDDGDVDLFVHNIQRERHGLYRNDVPDSDTGFLKVRLRATTTNPEAIGAIVVVRGPEGPTAQVLTRGSGFVTCQSPELVFGLGGQESAEVEVIWPGAKRESFGAVEAGSRVRLVEGSGTPEPYAARPRPLPDPLPPGLRVNEGDVLDTLVVANAQGEVVTLDVREAAGGDTLWLNLWATWCTTCVAEIPDLAALDAQEGQRVISIGMDEGDMIPDATARLASRGGTYGAWFLAPEGASAEGATSLRELVDLERLPLPTTLVLSPEGRVETILQGRVRPPGTEPAPGGSPAPQGGD